MLPDLPRKHTILALISHGVSDNLGAFQFIPPILVELALQQPSDQKHSSVQLRMSISTCKLHSSAAYIPVDSPQAKLARIGTKLGAER